MSLIGFCSPVSAIGQLYSAQPLAEVDVRTLQVRRPFTSTMHVTFTGRECQKATERKEEKDLLFVLVWK